MASMLKNLFSKLNIQQSKAIFNNNAKCSTTVLDRWNKYYSNAPTPYEVVNPHEEKHLAKELISKVNQQILQKQQGRLFAVVHVAGKQFKVTEGDVIVIEGYWPPETGEKICLDKVLLLGAADFSLIGCPVIQRGLVTVEATVIEKTLSHTKTHFRKKRRKQYQRINFYRIPQTMLRINNVTVNGEVDNPPDITSHNRTM